MNYLLDTCVLSELLKPKPDQSVTRWIATVSEDALFISVLTIGEFLKGIGKLADIRRAHRLRHWVETDLCQRFNGRILPVDQTVAAAWGTLCGEAARHGRNLPVIDSLIAVTARVQSMTVVTRNTADMHDTGVPVLNPWEAA